MKGEYKINEFYQISETRTAIEVFYKHSIFFNKLLKEDKNSLILLIESKKNHSPIYLRGTLYEDISLFKFF